jgi:hypothetical protein
MERNDVERTLQQNVLYLNEQEHFMHFDEYMVGKWLSEEENEIFCDAETPDEEKEKLRRSAYLTFYRKIRREKVASPNTIRGWFGIDFSTKPKREHIFHFAMVLALSEQQLQDYLVHGLLEPGIQINDYREYVYLYGLINHMTWRECQDMILLFERKMNGKAAMEQCAHTEKLWGIFREHQHDNKEDFLVSMCESMSMFKGYSMVVLNRFIYWKEEVSEYIKQDAGNVLLGILEEVGYFEWLKENHYSREKWEEYLSQYLANVSRRKKNGISKEYKMLIANLKAMAFAPTTRTTDLLAEIYSAARIPQEKVKAKRIRYRNRAEFLLPSGISFMSNKYVSQLLNVAEQKEREILLSQLRSMLMTMEPNDLCPDLAHEVLSKFSVKSIPKTVKQAEQLVNHLLVQQRKCCHLVSRGDILPLIHYVAQKRYEDWQSQYGYKYSRETAREFFVTMADEEMEKCQMERMNTAYEMDYLLLSCYGEQEMYSLSDVIEAADTKRPL